MVGHSNIGSALNKLCRFTVFCNSVGEQHWRVTFGWLKENRTTVYCFLLEENTWKRAHVKPGRMQLDDIKQWTKLNCYEDITRKVEDSNT